MTSRDRRDPAPQIAGAGSRRARLLAWWADQPAWVLLPAIALVLAALATTGPIVDPDSYWHVLLGQDIWSEHRLTGDPGRTFGPHEPWSTTQWLSELLLAGVHHVAGWTGMTALRAGAALVTAVTLARATLPGPGTRARLFVLGVAILVLACDVQERPASLVLPLVAVTGWWARGWLRDRALPRLPFLAATTALWANLHGTWVLAPIAWGVLTVIDAATDRTGRWRLAGRAALTTACGLLTPLGWGGLVAAVRIRDAASESITEWQPSSVAAPSFMLLLLLVAVLGLAAATSRQRPPTSQVLWVLAWTGFACLAFRNIMVAAVIVAPLAADLLASCWPEQPRPAGRPVRVLAAALVALTPAVATAGVVARGGVPDEVPTRLITALADQPGERRVVTEYGLLGAVQALSRPGVRTALDGRTDRYGKQGIATYLDLLAARPGWRNTLASLDPTDVVLPKDAALVDALTYSGWSVTGRSSGHVWLQPATANQVNPTGNATG